MQFKKHHKTIIFFLKILLQNKSYLAAFYLAQLEFYYANYKIANKFIDIFLTKYPRHPDAIYLKAQIFFLMNKSQKATALLIDLLKYSSREKTLIIIGKLIQDKQSFEKILQICNKKYKTTALKAWDYIMDIATKVEEYDKAKNYYQKKILENTVFLKPKKRKFFKVYEAQIALKDLKKVFDKLNIKMFLVSGTFLGCIRNNNILSHDYDIDIGIFEEDMDDNVLKALLKEGVFFQHEFDRKGILKLRHINGIMIDIFIHYREGNKIYHLGAKNKWSNTEFKLQKYKFLNGEYYGALDYELYLNENYGNNWRIPNKDFNSVLDTPNIEITNSKSYVVYLYKLLYNNYNNKGRIMKELEKYGEYEFVEKYKNSKLI